MFSIRWKPRRDGKRYRKGMAVVELAVCLPLLMIVAVGSIEATNAIFLKQRLTAAAYEGARSAITPGHTTAVANTAASAVLTQFGVSGASVSVSPDVTVSTTTGTQITVTVTAPFSTNSCMKPFIVGKALTNISASVVMNHQ